VIQALRAAGVVVLGGPKAISAGLIGSESPTPGFKTEYGDNTVSFELVDNMTEAVDHIHKYGSGHTEAIITENAATAQVHCVYCHIA
jgi:gamma-glutamyl phosphate reductase